MKPVTNLILILLGCLFGTGICCIFPEDLTGEWYSSSNGILTFTNTTFFGHTSTIYTEPISFTCDTTSGNLYVVTRELEIFLNVAMDIYMCWDLHKVTPTSYYFYNNAAVEVTSGENVHVVQPGTPVTMNDVCSVVPSVGSYEFLVKKGNSSDSAISCPAALQSIFGVTVYTDSIGACNGTNLTGNSQETSISFEFSDCASNTLFSRDGRFLCLNHASSENLEYVTLYNTNMTVGGNSVFRLVCLVYSRTRTTLNATAHPGVCDSAQTDISVKAPGVVFVMEDRYPDTVSVSDDDNTALIVGIVIGVLVFICVVIALIFLLWKLTRPKPKKPQYSTDINSVVTISGSVRTRPLSTTFKHLAEEIGLSVQRRDEVMKESLPSIKDKTDEPADKQRKSSIMITVNPIRDDTEEAPKKKKVKKKKKKRKEKKVRIPFDLDEPPVVSDQVMRLQDGRHKAVRFEDTEIHVDHVEVPKWQYLWERCIVSPRRRNRPVIPPIHRERMSPRSITSIEPRLSPTPEDSMEDIYLPGSVRVEPDTPWVMPQEDQDTVFDVVSKLWPKIWKSSAVNSANLNADK